MVLAPKCLEVRRHRLCARSYSIRGGIVTLRRIRELGTQEFISASLLPVRQSMFEFYCETG
jgi:hypothetical protein